ncbi:hypothetical protein JVT61DRAFT_5112 [Boletus reticuloceps]|uniref:Diphthamide biosynthesis protein 4 n=1 Tax=Boletus reticuloceps TaxID=495285 RepID=A0A8I2Z119_9AGAM|nr:hypothetical protein JVT61DRAFT_5112 [Boletus reticuloceps]
MLYPSSNFYNLLQIPRDASLKDIKAAYHRTLLRLHPDKQTQARHHHHAPPEEAFGFVDVALLKEAYRTLSDAGLRAVYDRSLRREEHARSCGPRPAQVVSLEEFTALTETREFGAGSSAEVEADADAVREWGHRCRCGGMYRITQDDLENGAHLVGCESCSEVIWVGYEEAPAMGDEEGE